MSDGENWGKGNDTSGRVKCYAKQEGLVEKRVCGKMTLKTFEKDIMKPIIVEVS